MFCGRIGRTVVGTIGVDDVHGSDGEPIIAGGILEVQSEDDLRPVWADEWPLLPDGFFDLQFWLEDDLLSDAVFLAARLVVERGRLESDESLFFM